MVYEHRKHVGVILI